MLDRIGANVHWETENSAIAKIDQKHKSKDANVLLSCLDNYSFS